MSALRLEFEWDRKKAESNFLKHGIEFDLAMTVFRDPLSATILEDTHGADEERWVTFGNCSLALIIHTLRQIGAESVVVRIISARKPTKREARL